MESASTGGPLRPVRLVEISSEQRFPAGAVVRFQLLDTVIHTWDVASALGADFLPDPELAGVTLQLARLIPQGEGRLGPGRRVRARGRRRPAGRLGSGSRPHRPERLSAGRRPSRQHG